MTTDDKSTKAPLDSYSDDGQDDSVGLTTQRNPRICIHIGLARRLVALGIPDDSLAIGRAVNGLAEVALSRGSLVVSDISDVTTTLQSLDNRCAELVEANILLAKLLAEIGLDAERQDLRKSLQGMINLKT